MPTAERIDADPNMTERVNITDEIIPGDNPRPHVSYLVIRDLVSISSAIFYSEKMYHLQFPPLN